MLYGFDKLSQLPDAIITDWYGMIGCSGKKVSLSITPQVQQAIIELVQCPECNRSLWSFALLADGHLIFRVDDYDVCTARQMDNFLDVAHLEKAYRP